LPAQLIFHGPSAGCIRPLDSTLDVFRVVAEGIVELDFDPARDFEQAAVDRSDS
jgi:hypothetical protein